MPWFFLLYTVISMEKSKFVFRPLCTGKIDQFKSLRNYQSFGAHAHRTAPRERGGRRGRRGEERRERNRDIPFSRGVNFDEMSLLLCF